MPAEADACLYQAPDSAKNPLRLVRERERDEMRDAERKVGEGEAERIINLVMGMEQVKLSQ